MNGFAALRFSVVAGTMLGVLGLAAPTQAATVKYSAGEPHYEAAPGEVNALQVIHLANTNVRFIDYAAGAKMVDGDGSGGCSITATKPPAATCPFSQTGEVELGDRNDIAILYSEAPHSAIGLTIDAGEGNDILIDQVLQDFDNAAIFEGEEGDDYLTSSGVPTSGGLPAGADYLEGGDGNDTVNTSGAGNPGIIATELGTGKDTFVGGDSNDLVTADGGVACYNFLEDSAPGETTGHADDSIDGGGGSDCLDGGDGDDVVNGGAGDDFGAGFGSSGLFGGAGADRLDGGPGADKIDGGAGSDALDFTSRTDGVVVDLASQMSGESTGTDVVAGVERVDGGSGDDILSGDANNNVLLGNGGINRLDGRKGADLLIGGPSTDYITSGGDSAGYVFYADSVFCGTGTDTVYRNTAAFADSVFGDCETLITKN